MAFTQDQTLTAKCMPELVRMVNDASSNDKIMDTLEFIKTEDGQMQCLKCQNIFTDKETHQTQCFKPSDNDEGHVYSNAIGEGPKMDGVPLPESSYQLSCFTGIKEELPDFDNFCTEIKIEPMETNINSVNQSTESEDLMQCLNCKLYFNDRCAYLDHKIISCNASLDQLTNVGLSNSADTVDSFETPIKTELLDESQIIPDKGPINVEAQNDQDMPSFEIKNSQQPQFTCSCTICGAVFDDFFTYSVHKKNCKKPQIGTLIEELNLRKTTCAICKEKFQSKQDLSKHIASIHVRGNAKRSAKKRKHAEVDADDKQLSLGDFDGNTSLNCAAKSDNGSVDVNKCPVEGCANFFHSILAVQRHVRLVHGTTMFDSDKQVHQCQNKGCGRLFDTRKCLKDHIQDTHMNKKPIYPCRYKDCGHSFYTKTLLLEHIQVTHMASVRKRKSKRPVQVTRTLCTCSLCFKQFQSKDDVFKHLNEVHNVSGTINANLYAVENLLLCSICKLYFGHYNFHEHSKRCGKNDFMKTALNQSTLETIPSSSEVDIDELDAKHDEQESVKNHESHTRHDKSTDEEIIANNDDHCTKNDNKTKEQDIRLHYTKSTEQKIKTEHDEIFTKHDDRLIEDDKMTDKWESFTKHDDYTKHDKTSTKHDASVYEYLQNYLQHLTEICDKYMCNICSFTFTHKNEILAHLVKTHGVLDRFSGSLTYIGTVNGCKMCRFAFPQQHVLLGHIVSAHAVLDSVQALEMCSNLTGKSVEKIKEDISFLVQAGDMMYCCDFNKCELIFSTKAGFVSHRREHYTKTCSFCNFKYNEDSDYNAHLSTHIKEKIDRRKDKGLTTKPKISQDSKNGTDISSRVEDQPENMKGTEIKVEGTETKMEGTEIKMKETETVMNAKITQDSRLDKEIKSEAETLEAVKETESSIAKTKDCYGKFDCHLCDKSFPYQHVLCYHLQAAHQIASHRCNWGQCTAMFATASDLKLHVKSHMEGKKLAKGITKVCPYCPFEYDNDPLYRQHFFNEHKHETNKGQECKRVLVKKNFWLDLDYNRLPYKCKVKGCGKAFLYHSDLVKHTQLDVHTFLCPEENCRACFKDQTALKTHVKVDHHTALKTQVNLDQHPALKTQVNVDHLKPNKRVYTCGVKGCLESFDSKRSLGKHNRENHIKPLITMQHEEDSASTSNVYAKENEHILKESPADFAGKDSDDKMLFTTSGFKIELVDDS